MNIEQAFSVLRERLGTDRMCASHIGVTPQHYNAMKNGRVSIPQRTADYIIMKASELESFPVPPAHAAAAQARA